MAANVINLGADLGAMGAAVNLLIGNGTGPGLPIWLTVTRFRPGLGGA